MIHITTLPLGAMDNLVYVVADTATRQAVFVDPAWDIEALQQCLTDNNYQLTGVILTHSHYDHISALPDVLARYDVPVYLSEAELSLGNVNKACDKSTRMTLIKDGDTLTLGDSRINVIETPGHTIGSVCFYVDNQLIAGDTLFIDGCGRCNFPESDVEKMWDSLQKIKKLPDDTIIYCGHHYGQQTTDTLGRQKHTNPYLLIDDKAFFIDFRQNLQSQYRRIPFVPSSHEEMQEIATKHLQK